MESHRFFHLVWLLFPNAIFLFFSHFLVDEGIVCITFLLPLTGQQATVSFRIFLFKNMKTWDFPGGPVVKDLPSNAGDVGSIPGWGTKIPHATGQLSLCATTTEPLRHS